MHLGGCDTDLKWLRQAGNRDRLSQNLKGPLRELSWRFVGLKDINKWGKESLRTKNKIKGCPHVKDKFGKATVTDELSAENFAEERGVGICLSAVSCTHRGSTEPPVGSWPALADGIPTAAGVLVERLWEMGLRLPKNLPPLWLNEPLVLGLATPWHDTYFQPSGHFWILHETWFLGLTQGRTLPCSRFRLMRSGTVSTIRVIASTSHAPRKVQKNSHSDSSAFYF